MTDRWRLNNRDELYDMTSDPGQSENVANEHPEVMSVLRAGYEEWWTSLTPAFDQYARIVIGSDYENPANMTCHDWHSSQVPWNQNMIRNAPRANGYWMIHVSQPGKYEVTLRQRPTIARFPIQANHARVKIGEIEARKAIPDGATAVTLSMDLKPGPARMQTWFSDEGSGESRGAFFVEARRVD